MSAPALNITATRPVLSADKALEQVIRRVVEQIGGVPTPTTYCPMCEYGSAGEGKTPDLCRQCSTEDYVAQLAAKLDRLESRLRGMEAYHG